MADNVMIYKYVVKNVARSRGMTATFMPKPLFGDNGSGMHVHQSIWLKVARSLPATAMPALARCCGTTSAGCSSTLRRLLAICAPTVNSYRRLVPGFEAPVNLGYSQRNRSAACRIPMYSLDPKAKRVEFRCPDPSCNPYLAFAAMLMAGLDGIRSRIDPGEPIDKNLYDLPPVERAANAVNTGIAWRGSRCAPDGPAVPARGRRVHDRRASRPMWPTSARTRSTRYACVRIHTSLSSTTTFSGAFREGLAARGDRQGYTVRSRRSPRQ